MAWSVSKTWVSGDVVTARTLNNELRDGIGQTGLKSSMRAKSGSGSDVTLTTDYPSVGVYYHLKQLTITEQTTSEFYSSTQADLTNQGVTMFFYSTGLWHVGATISTSTSNTGSGFADLILGTGPLSGPNFLFSSNIWTRRTDGTTNDYTLNVDGAVYIDSAPKEFFAAVKWDFPGGTGLPTVWRSGGQDHTVTFWAYKVCGRSNR